MARPLLGAHVSVAGGFAEGIRRGTELECTALQIFVKSPNQWKAKAILQPDADGFRAAHRASAIGPIAAHAAYLINLAAENPEILAKSRAGLSDELERCDLLGVPGLVVHPGAHLGRGEDAGLTAIAESIDAIVERRLDRPAKILVELTAGQGSVLGKSLAELATIRARAKHGARIGFCLDTCHAFSSGYSIETAAGWDDFLAEIEKTIGFASIECIHLNDSKHEKGSKKDRHENIGEGHIGVEAFRRLLAEPRFGAIPLVLETPLGDDELGHARDLATLRRLMA
jgi:deoxyribonuclease-4